MTAVPSVTTHGLHTAAVRLSESHTGRIAAGLLLAFLRGSGGSLDTINQRAVMTLLAGFYGQYPGTVFDLLKEANMGVVKPEPEDDEP